MAFRLTLACPRHPKYDPKSGEQGIIGGCPNCYALLDLAKVVQRTKEKMEKRLFSSFKDLERFELEKASQVLALAQRVVRKVREGEDLEPEESRLLSIF